MLVLSELKVYIIFLCCIWISVGSSFAQTYHADEKLYQIYSAVIDHMPDDRKIVFVYDSLVTRDIKRFDFSHPESRLLNIQQADWAKDSSWHSFLTGIDAAKIVTNGFQFKNKFTSTKKIKLVIPGKKGVRLTKKLKNNTKYYGTLLLSPIVISNDGAKAVFTINYFHSADNASSTIYFAVLKNDKWEVFRSILLSST